MQAFDLTFEEAATRTRLSTEIADATRRSKAAKGVLFRRLAQDFRQIDAYLNEVAASAAKNGARAACGAGCAWCCHQNVLVSPLEAFYLAEAIAFFPDADALKAKILETADAIAGLDAVERFARQIPCPLLDATHGLCTAYESRPFICRSTHSTSAAACETAFRTRGATAEIEGIRRLFMLGAIARVAYVDGFDQGGLHGRTVELTAALATILRTPDAYERWSAGEDVFDC